MQDYPWYKTVNKHDDIEQGDFIVKCPVVIPPSSNISQEDEIDIDIQEINSIVLSQSCDLVNNKLETVLVCPYYTFTKFLEDIPDKETDSKKKVKKIKENLLKGNYSAFHLLSKGNEHFNENIIVDFKNVYGINFKVLKEIVNNKDNRIRLLPPYREHLSQAFARYFMRVGLPQNIEFD